MTSIRMNATLSSAAAVGSWLRSWAGCRARRTCVACVCSAFVAVAFVVFFIRVASASSPRIARDTTCKVCFLLCSGYQAPVRCAGPQTVRRKLAACLRAMGARPIAPNVLDYFISALTVPFPYAARARARAVLIVAFVAALARGVVRPYGVGPPCRMAGRVCHCQQRRMTSPR